jgi:hypothetical protein
MDTQVSQYAILRLLQKSVSSTDQELFSVPSMLDHLIGKESTNAKI